jgi:hypothetical protein
VKEATNLPLTNEHEIGFISSFIIPETVSLAKALGVNLGTDRWQPVPISLTSQSTADAW